MKKVGHLLINSEKAEKSEFWNNEKKSWKYERYHHFTHGYQKPQSYELQFVRYGVRQIFGDIVLLPMCNINQNHLMYGSWDIKCKGRSLCHFAIFSPLTLLTTQKNQLFQKIICLLIISLILFTANDNHTMYNSWNIKGDRQNFSKKIKKLLEVLSFYTWAPLIKIMWCMVPEVWGATDKTFFQFGQIFSLLHLRSCSPSP